MAGFVPGILPSTLRAGKAVQIRSRRICRDRGARRHGRQQRWSGAAVFALAKEAASRSRPAYVEHSDRAKASHDVLLGRRSRGLVQHAG
jgi:hypothetical protein